jgi:hypothetical protein
MTQEVLVHIDLNEKGEPMVELRYQGKLKTFCSDYSINRFVGMYNGLEHEQVTPEKYVVAGMHEAWNGGIEMTAEEWCKCVRAIYSVF